jgi:hypothetical protein
MTPSTGNWGVLTTSFQDEVSSKELKDRMAGVELVTGELKLLF